MIQVCAEFNYINYCKSILNWELAICLWKHSSGSQLSLLKKSFQQSCLASVPDSTSMSHCSISLYLSIDINNVTNIISINFLTIADSTVGLLELWKKTARWAKAVFLCVIPNFHPMHTFHKKIRSKTFLTFSKLIDWTIDAPPISRIRTCVLYSKDN